MAEGSSEDMSFKAQLARIESAMHAGLAAVAVLRNVLGLPPGDGASATLAVGPLDLGRDSGSIGSGHIRSDEFFRMSIPDGIVKYLNIVKKPQPPRAIVEGLQRGGMLSNAKNFASNVWTAINRLKDSGIVVNTSNGWGLAEWYPGKPPKAPPDAPKGKSVKKAAKATKPAAKKAAAPAKAAPRAASVSAYQSFVNERLASGKTMKEANAEWQAHKLEKQA
jgi:hypothetical protein